MDQYVYNKTDKFWGFKSFNEFFIRDIKDITITRPCNKNPYVITAFGDVAYTACEVDVSLNTTMYLKNESYSLQQIFNNNVTTAKQFEGGAILQVFFSAHKYHKYHSPVDGTVESAMRVPGIVYAIDEV